MNKKTEGTLNVRLYEKEWEKFYSFQTSFGLKNKSETIRKILYIAEERVKGNSDLLLLPRIKLFFLLIQDELTDEDLQKEYRELCEILFQENLQS